MSWCSDINSAVPAVNLPFGSLVLGAAQLVRNYLNCFFTNEWIKVITNQKINVWSLGKLRKKYLNALLAIGRSLA